MIIIALVDVPATPSRQLLELQKELERALESYAKARTRRDRVATALREAVNGLAQLNREQQIRPLASPALIARHEDKVAALRDAELEARAAIQLGKKRPAIAFRFT
jgi:hypothetical protein